MQHISNFPHIPAICPACASHMLFFNGSDYLHGASVSEIIAYLLITVGILIILSMIAWIFILKYKKNKIEVNT